MMLYNKQNLPPAPTGNTPYRFMMNAGMRHGAQPERQYSGSNMFNPSNSQYAGRPTGSAPAFSGNHQSAQGSFDSKLPMFSRGGK